MILLYLLIFGILMLVYCSVYTPYPVGEWDDYTFPVASLLNDHNFSISDSDVAFYKELFPVWAQYADSYSLSGYTAKGGGEISWYFPVYALACIPFTLLLKCTELPTVYAFPFTNLFLLMLAVAWMNKYLKASDRTKLLMVVLLTLNPIVFYISWISAEVFIFSFLVIGLTCWYNQWYRRAAFFVSVAGMLNPTIMSIGIVMIAEYLFYMFRSKTDEQSWGAVIKERVPGVIGYGCCYIIGIVPMIYNYYNTGHINLTASYSSFTHGAESTLSRFFAYLFDLNFGVLPYFPVIFLLSFFLLAIAILKRNVRYIEWFLAFIINVVLYSFMVHINCGMSGISRYNAWGTVLLIFAVVLIGMKAVPSDKIKKVCSGAIWLGVILTATIVFSYGPNCASKTSYIEFTPIAEFMLDNYSELYHPLRSTFNSRTTHIDGGYQYETPIAYSSEKDGYVRKILASENDKEVLLKQYASAFGESEHFIEQVNRLRGVDYISLSDKDRIRKVSIYEPGEILSFAAADPSGLRYVIHGMSSPEDWGTWTDGKEALLGLRANTQSDLLHCRIAAGVYNSFQDVTISVNGVCVYQNTAYLGEDIEFDFSNANGGVIEMIISLPQACSPAETGSDDKRVLGLSIEQMEISEVSAAQ